MARNAIVRIVERMVKGKVLGRQEIGKFHIMNRYSTHLISRVARNAPDERLPCCDSRVGVRLEC